MRFKDKYFPYYAWQAVTVLEKGAGCWPFQSQTKNMIMRVMHMGNLTVILFIFGIRLWQEFERKNFHVVVENSLSVIICFCIQVKGIMFYINEKQRKSFYERVLELWKNTNDEEEIIILKQHADAGVNVIIMYMIFADLCYQGIPIFSGMMEYLRNPNITYYKKELPFYIEIYIDQEKYFYHIFIVMFLMILFAAIITFSHELTFFQSVQHIIASFKIIEIRLSRLSNIAKRVEDGLDTLKDTEREVFDSISEIVHLHNVTLKNVKFVDYAFGTTYFIILLFNSLLFGTSLVLIDNNVGDTLYVIRYGLLFLGLMMHFFIIFWPSQQITDANESLFHACCSCEWYKLSKRSLNSLRIMMLRSYTKCEITAIGMFVLSLETFAKLFKTGLSFFAVFARN